MMPCNGVNHRNGSLAHVVAWFMILGFTLPAFGKSTDFLSRNDGRTRGDLEAPVTLLEYSDFTCGFCEKFFLETWPRLFSEYVQTGKVRLIYRDFPRALRGPGVDMALATRCAGEQGQYWAMHDRLFSTKDKYGTGQLEAQAKSIGLNEMEFSQCLQSGRHLEAVFQDFQEGGSLGIRGTPGFLLYLTPNPHDGPRLLIPGAFPYEIFKEQIDGLLEKAGGSFSKNRDKYNRSPTPERMKFQPPDAQPPDQGNVFPDRPFTNVTY